MIFATETLDGKLASSSGLSRLSCHEDFVLQHVLRREVDAVMVGANTAIKDDPRLTVRLIPGKSPARIVVDSKLKVNSSLKIFRLPGRKFLITSKDVKDSTLTDFLKEGVKVIKVSRKDKLLDLKEGLEKLAQYGIRRILVEGGGILINSLLSQGLVDEVRVTIAPRIFGKGVSFAGSQNADLVKDLDVLLNLNRVEVLCGGWVHLVYKVLYPKEPLC